MRCKKKFLAAAADVKNFYSFGSVLHWKERQFFFLQLPESDGEQFLAVRVGDRRLVWYESNSPLNRQMAPYAASYFVDCRRDGVDLQLGVRLPTAYPPRRTAPSFIVSQLTKYESAVCTRVICVLLPGVTPVLFYQFYPSSNGRETPCISSN